MADLQKLKSDLKNNNLANFYIFHGVEDYLKNHYIDEIQKKKVDDNFKSFNLDKFNENSFNKNDFYDAVERLPAMSETKMVIVRDVDLFSLKADAKEQIFEILEDLPEYICVIFDYSNIEYKPDKRQKIYKILEQKAQIIEFSHLTKGEIIKWITGNFEKFDLKIESKTCEYMTFVCGLGLTNLKNEIGKLSSYSKEIVTCEDIDAVCSRALEANIFDLVGLITNGKVFEANKLLGDLLLLKNAEYEILAIINSQFRRLYIAKLSILENKNNQYLMKITKIRSEYAVSKDKERARSLSIKYLRKASNLSSKALLDMVSINQDKKQIIELLMLKIGALND